MAKDRFGNHSFFPEDCAIPRAITNLAPPIQSICNVITYVKVNLRTQFLSKKHITHFWQHNMNDEFRNLIHIKGTVA